MSADTSDDIRVSTDSLARLAEGYRKIRNTFRYLLGSVGDFDPAKLAARNRPVIPRVPTRPGKAAVERRLEQKRRQSARKRERVSPGD